MPFSFSPLSRSLVELALAEDLCHGDVTTDAIFAPQDVGRAAIRAKDRLVVAGRELVEEVYRQLGGDVAIVWFADDGDLVDPGHIGVASGPTRTLLRGERVALNFIRHLSGVATMTHALASRLEGTGTRLVDTRKTTPGFRELEKFAVRMGGGTNHRHSLGGGVMIKDNHIAAAGGIAEAVERARHHAPFLVRIEVEADNLDQVDAAVAAGADVVLLDNMDAETMRTAVARHGGAVLLEASGNVDAAALDAIRDVGVDFVSCGAITHSAPSADLSMDLLAEGAEAQVATVVRRVATGPATRGSTR